MSMSCRVLQCPEWPLETAGSAHAGWSGLAFSVMMQNPELPDLRAAGGTIINKLVHQYKQYLILSVILQPDDQERLEGFHIFQEIAAQNCSGKAKGEKFIQSHSPVNWTTSCGGHFSPEGVSNEFPMTTCSKILAYIITSYITLLHRSSAKQTWTNGSHVMQRRARPKNKITIKWQLQLLRCLNQLFRRTSF